MPSTETHAEPILELIKKQDHSYGHYWLGKPWPWRPKEHTQSQLEQLNQTKLYKEREKRSVQSWDADCLLAAWL